MAAARAEKASLAGFESSAADYGSVLAAGCNGDDEQRREASVHLRLFAMAVGLLADAYDLFAIDLVVLLLELHYGKGFVGISEKSLLVGAMLGGVIIGQLFFGRVADVCGRFYASLLTASLTIVGALLCALAGWSDPARLCTQLAAARFLLGLGVGGEYPVSATISCEAGGGASKRGKQMIWMISTQGWGMLLSASMAILFVSVGISLDTCWRLLLAFGALPSTIAFVLRLQLRHEVDASLNREAAALADTATAESSAAALPSAPQPLRTYIPLLVGTAATWCLMNFTLYSMGSFKSSILEGLSHGEITPAQDELLRVSRFAVITSVVALSGFGAALALLDHVGRYGMQLGGFVGLATVFGLLSAVSAGRGGSATATAIFVPLFCLMFFFQNCGPNTSVFIIAAETFPTSVRGTCHGISAACGKCGALLGSAVLPPLATASGLSTMFAVCGASALLGALVTFAATPRWPPDAAPSMGASVLRKS
eukprot:TRINITY_DN11747_c0_g1_i1.p1 TRINITY_DN11747_c0_g1~~TRINITY_DN11747_c0_g1_i1.p1  ORF type:complete len:484 (+),score=116.61 TRINITY_DN11747_c0_g1_i1:146-1597(+)